MELLRHCYDEATRLLSEYREALDQIADYLYEHETITGKEFMKLFRELTGIQEEKPEETEEEKTTEETAGEAAEASDVEVPETAPEVTDGGADV